MTDYIIQVVSAIVGSVGFALIFHVKRDKIPFIILGSGLGTAVYLFFDYYTQNAFLSNMLAAVFCTASAEFLARWRKAPATLFLIIHIIPLVPGGSLFYAMRSFILNDRAAFANYAASTFYTAAGIAVGILLVTSCISILNSYRRPEHR